MIGSAAADFLRRVRGKRETAKIAVAAAVFLISWILGRAVAVHNTSILVLFMGAAVIYLIFFHKTTLLWIGPLAMCLPNLALDIPGPWAVSIEDAIVMIALAGMITRNLIGRKPIIPRGIPFLQALAMFWAVAMISLIKVPMVSPESMMFIIKDLMRLTLMILFYVVLIDAISTKEHVLTVIRTMLILSIPMAAVSWYIYLTRSPFFYDLLTMKPAFLFYKTKILRMISIMGSTSFTGLYYAVILAIGITHPVWSRSRRMRAPKLVFFGILTSCLVMTFNRGTWVGILLGMSTLMFIGKLSWKKIAVAGILSLGILLMATTHFFSQFDVEQKVNVVIEVSRSTGTARLVRWISAINVMQDQPLLGVGYDNYAYVYGHYSIEKGVVPTYGSPHNMYVDFMTGTGFIGFAFFAVAFIRLWRMHLENLRKSQDPDLQKISLGLFLALTFFLGASGFDSFFFKPHHTSFLIFLLWAVTTAIWRMNREQDATVFAAGEETKEIGASADHSGKWPGNR